MIGLRKLAAAELAAGAALFRRRAPLQLGTSAGPLTVWPVPEAEAPAASFRLDLRLGEGWAQLCTEAALAELLLAPELPGMALDSLDPELKGLVLELVLEPLVVAAEKALGRPVRLAAGPAPIALPYAVDFSAGLDGGSWPLRLCLDLRALEAVTRAYQRAPIIPAEMPELVLPLTAEAGRTRLSLALLRRAAPGDLLLLEESGLRRGRLDLVLGGMLAFACSIEGTALSYTGEARNRVASEASAAVGQLDEAPVELVFELGRLSMALGELRALAPGHVFELGRDLRHPVDVMLGGRKIGEGELVQIGERVGVRLRSMVPRATAEQ